MKRATMIGLLVLCFIHFHCASAGYYRGNTARDINIKRLAGMLNDSLRKPALKNKEIGILSFANLNQLEEVEPLGRYLQENLSHVLFDLGFRVLEIRLGDHIYFTPAVGELNLTRLKDKLKNTRFEEIKSIILGTYIDAGDYIYVNSKLIELENSIVMASGEIRIRKGEYLSQLLEPEEGIKTKKDQKEIYERFALPEKEEEKK
jgi:hypothetical protein